MTGRELTPEYLDDLDWMAKAELDHWHSRAESDENQRKLCDAVLLLTSEIRIWNAVRDANREVACSV